jgi:hypothetical protein
VGAFADTNTNRQGSGASYWGIMNLSDNAYEYTVLATSNTGGLLYNGEHGNGILIFDANGVYPDGKNTWRLPTNTAGWWSVRGIYLYPLTAEAAGRCNTGYSYFGWGLQGNGVLSDRSTGYVGKRSLGGTGYTSQKNTALFAGIRCVRTALDTTALQ